LDHHDHGKLGNVFVSMSSKDTQGVPVPGGVKAKSSTFSKQDVVLMILAGIYHGDGGKASSKKDDVYIKELGLFVFVMGSLWCYCYLCLHGLMEESSPQQQDQVEEGSDFGSGHADECVENIRSGSQKNLFSSDLRMAERKSEC